MTLYKTMVKVMLQQFTHLCILYIISSDNCTMSCTVGMCTLLCVSGVGGGGGIGCITSHLISDLKNS